MNIRHLQIFKVVCEEMSFTKAADKLYMTQPAVSHTIADLELETGHILFERIARKIYLTEAGKVLQEKAIRILELYDELEKNFYMSDEDIPIRIGSSITIGNFWLSAILKKFQEKFPKTSVKVVIDSTVNIEEKLNKNEIDIAFLEGVIQNSRLKKIPFSSYNIGAYCSKEFFQGSEREIVLKELIKYPLLLREKGSAIRDCFDSVLRIQGFSAEPAWVSVNSQALIQGAKNGMGIAVLPENIITYELKSQQLIELKIKDTVLQNWNYVVYHKDKKLTAPLKKIIEIAEKWNN